MAFTNTQIKYFLMVMLLFIGSLAAQEKDEQNSYTEVVKTNERKVRRGLI